MNIAGLVVAIVTGHWYLKQIYWYAYFPIAGTIWLLGALGQLPRVKASTKGEGHERRAGALSSARIYEGVCVGKACRGGRA